MYATGLNCRQTDRIFRFRLRCFCLVFSFFQEKCFLADFFAAAILGFVLICGIFTILFADVSVCLNFGLLVVVEVVVVYFI